MHVAIKNMFQFDETVVLIAGVAKLIFHCCYQTHFGPTWLLKFDSPSPLAIMSMRMLQKQIIGLNIFVRL